MRLGLVRFLNARPLDYGFRQSREHELIEETPAQLYERLSAGELDAALISSVEYLRNRDRFGACLSVGVCCERVARSILYLRAAQSRDAAPERLFTDTGSRSSVALLECLLAHHFDAQPELIPAAPEAAPDLALADRRSGALLIGDGALRFRENGRRLEFQITDLAQWWRRSFGLPFVFALWAYPRERPVPDAFFEQSLAEGLARIREIARSAPFADAEGYLRENLHYKLSSDDRAGLAEFERRVNEIDTRRGR